MMMDSGIATDGSRLFTRFFDAVDMIGSFPAAATLAEVNAIAAGHGLRFPLVIDLDRTLREHLAVAEYAPASARFGAYVDNLPGMNWLLPTGRRVRIGERVVKSTTGYDLFRFLLHSDGRYGQATDYVLRLRPVGGESFAVAFTGDAGALAAVRRRLMASSWNHWIDRIDQVSVAGSPPRIEAEVDCLAGEKPRFLAFFAAVAGESGTGMVEASGVASPGLPAFSIKSTPARVAELSAICAGRLGGQARALLLNGVVLVYPDNPPDAAFLADLGRSLEPLGGHLLGPSLPPRDPIPAEAIWAASLNHQWNAL